MIDLDQLRDEQIRLHHLDKADAEYTFYHDETNNVAACMTAKNLTYSYDFVMALMQSDAARLGRFDRRRTGSMGTQSRVAALAAASCKSLKHQGI